MLLALTQDHRPEFFGTMNFQVHEYNPYIRALREIETTNLKISSHIKPSEEAIYCSLTSYERSKETGMLLCDDRIADALWENPDVLRELFAQMPDKESLCLCFEGTVFRCKDNFLYIRCVHFYKGHFTNSYITLSSKNTNTNFVSVVLQQ